MRWLLQGKRYPEDLIGENRVFFVRSFEVIGVEGVRGADDAG